MLTFNAQAVAQSLPYDRLIEAIEDAFRGEAEVPDRTQYPVRIPGEADGTLLLMPAWRVGGVLGIKIVTVFPGNLQKNLPSVGASYLLLDATTGQALGMLDGAELTVRRTAAASAVASKYLSRADSSTLLMVGSGKLAPHLIRAHAAVRPLKRVLIWGRKLQTAQRLADGFVNESYSVAAVEDLESAVKAADVISCATLATEPLIKGRWLREGQHLDLVGSFTPQMSEADGDALAVSDVYVDTRAGALAEAGEIVQALASGKFSKADVVGDLFDLVRGTCPARRSPQAITLFKSVGSAIEDLAAAELATKQNKGN
ncbi:MAG TPA: ornithine cyclodeaminase family protein [Povalibacter sp.]|nr:ornithine cyclodeaminase family protein [Povalibacter sp.]